MEKLSAGTLTDYDRYLFREGTDEEAWRKMGAHPAERDGQEGILFRLWAPNARKAELWTSSRGFEASPVPLSPEEGGLWSAFVPGIGEGERYLFHVTGADGIARVKADPYAFASELRPGRASVVCGTSRYVWQDTAWQETMAARKGEDRPVFIYEVHPGSWQRADDSGFLNYRVIADRLADYVCWMGYTHVELIGICEHPLDESWGYQVSGYFAPTSRHGSPDDFRYFVDTMHRRGIGVILDWVPAHFPKDSFGLEAFDGTPLYEHPDPLLREFPEWGTYAFHYGRLEVRSFLLSSAFYWIREFHIDALRVDAVAAMLFRNFGRSEWRPDSRGGCENEEGIAFLQLVNRAVAERTNAFMIAEDSSIRAGITRPAEGDGLGFAYKWNLGWMNETLRYLAKDPLFRRYHHDLLTHPADYCGEEHFLLPLSHDETVHLKKSLLKKSPGSREDQFGALKSLLMYQAAFPGKKLLFMGQEFGVPEEWNEKKSLAWELADDFGHRDVMLCERDLLHLVRKYPALWRDTGYAGFEWIDRNDADRDLISFLRRVPGETGGEVAAVCHFAPVGCDISLRVPRAGIWRRIFSTYDHLPGQGGPAETGFEPLLNAEPADGGGVIRYHLRPYESLLLAFSE